MNDFLKLVANDLRKRFGNDMSHIVVIFPNKRASLFLNDYLIQNRTETIWSPGYMSVTEFFCSLSNKTLADPIDTVCRLYKHYIKHTGLKENNENSQENTSNEDNTGSESNKNYTISLDKFYGWGEQLLSDFDDADKQLADPASLFRDIKEYAELESYDYLTPEQIEQLKRFAGDFSTGQIQGVREKFNQLWSKALAIYTDLREELSRENLAYEGQLFREVAEALDKDEIALPNNIEHVAIVGFNAIDRVEHKLFKKLKDKKMAIFYWDYDTCYAGNKQSESMEAGLFMNKNLQDFPNALDESCFTNFLHEEKKQRSEQRTIEFAAASTDYIQCQSVTEWLKNKQNFNPQTSRRTAIVLCNENMLLPVIHSLPDQIDNQGAGQYAVNITKGFPFTHTPAFGCIINQIKLYENEANQLAAKKKNGQTATGQYTTNKQVCIEFLTKLSESISNEANNPERSTMNDELFDKLYADSYFIAYTTTCRFIHLVQDNTLNIRPTTLFRLLKQVVKGQTVPFNGDPADGLQIMGVLETRCIDFDNILLLSVNEGVLPCKSSDSSFIPFLIRKMHGLTTPDRRNSVYAYYFYRLLQRAQRVRLVYNTSTEGMQKGEMSRFMRAMLVEWNEKLHIRHLSLESVPKLLHLTQPEAHIPEDSKPLFTRLSPSALKVYFNCPLQFYYRYVKKLRPKQTEDPIINANDFGTVFHRAAELIYENASNNKCTEITLENLKYYLDSAKEKELTNFVNTAFAEIIQKNQTIKQSPITVRAIINYLRKLLQYETGAYEEKSAQVQSFKLLGTEKHSEILLDIPYCSDTIQLTIYGEIDRQDEAKDNNGKSYLRIIDYKTGKMPPSSKLTLNSFFEPSSCYPANQMQVLLYSLMCLENNNKEIIPMLLYVPSLSKHDFSPYVYIDNSPITDFRQIADTFKKGLIKTLAEIIRPGRVFEPTEITENCRYCDFKILCGR